MDQRYIDYYFSLKNVWQLHVRNNFGKSPDIPSGFSESLCRHLFDLDKTNTINDASNSEDEIEIKATGTHEGKTTISRSNDFKFLIWMYFDFNKDELKTYKLSRHMFDLDKGIGRKSIRLRTIIKNNTIDPEIFKFIQ